MSLKGFCRAVLMTVAMTAAAGFAHAQPPPLSGQDEPPAASPMEIQRMFDAYALMQAQDQLKLADDQFAQFMPRFKALQEVRQRLRAERGRAVRELFRLSRTNDADESVLRERLKTLQDIDARSALELKKAFDAVDQVLDIRQQVRFRLFEETMERRKIELITRARQNQRARAGR